MKTILITFILISTAFGQSIKDLTERPVYNSQKITDNINIDGRFDEYVWSNAQIATNFTGSGIFQDQPAELRTEAKIIYDDKYLYVAFTAFVDKEDLRYSVTKRDNLDGRDDRVFIQIDAFDDESLIYGIGVSASNAQIDGRAGCGWDQSLDLVYDLSLIHI